MSNVTSVRISFLASWRTVSNAFGSKKVHFSAANERFNPGAIFNPIKAASIGMVPEPQHGS